MSEATKTDRESASSDDGSGGDTTDRFGGGGGKTMLVGYIALLVIVALVLWALLGVGGGLKAPQEAGGGAKDPRSQANADKILWKLLLAGILILATCRLVGGLLRKFYQPHVIGEIDRKSVV
jgi:hypothetical protein